MVTPAIPWQRYTTGGRAALHGRASGNGSRGLDKIRHRSFSPGFLLPPLIVGDTLALLVDERDHGGIDLNGDTDAADQVLHLFEVDTGHLLNVGLADATVRGPFGSPLGTRNPLPLETSAQKVMMLVGEADQGGSDLNQDGDADDQVAVVINAQNERVKSRNRYVRMIGCSST